MIPLSKGETAVTVAYMFSHTLYVLYFYISDHDSSIPNGDVNQNIIKPIKRPAIEPFTPHAFSKIFTGEKRESLSWLIIAIIGFCISSVIIFRLISKYYRYEVITEVTWNVTSRNVFPSITFCDVDLMIGNYFAYCGIPHGQKYDNKSRTCTHKQKKKEHLKNVLNTTTKWSNGIFHVSKCYTWDGKICTTNQYFRSVGRLNHTCFTWNWNGDLFDMYGHAYIEFTINDTSRSDRSFIFGEIHDPNVFEIGMSNSFRIEASKVFELRIRKTMIKRLPAPFPSKCVTSMPHHIFPGRYTRRTCVDSVNYLEMLKECGDILDYHKLHIPKDILKKYKRNRTISEALKCMLSYSSQQIREVTIEKCPIACEEIDLYATTTFHELQKSKVGSRVFYAIDVQYQDIDHYKIIEVKNRSLHPIK